MLTKTDAVTNQLVERIRDESFASGDRLPTADMLAEEYGVSRGTARSAIAVLFGRGLIFKRGNSWYVERRQASR